jgi:hypothetical protein
VLARGIENGVSELKAKAQGSKASVPASQRKAPAVQRKAPAGKTKTPRQAKQKGTGDEL